MYKRRSSPVEEKVESMKIHTYNPNNKEKSNAYSCSGR
jgi:hypothetical protein